MQNPKDTGYQGAGYRETRPWGEFSVIYEEGVVKMKRITVLPEQSLSLQMHHKREEYWVVLQGTATVTVGDKILQLKRGETVYIGKETRHRLANESKENLIIAEMQIGEYLGEDDIVRFADHYGRVQN